MSVIKNITHCVFDMDGLLLGKRKIFQIFFNFVNEMKMQYYVSKAIWTQILIFFSLIADTEPIYESVVRDIANFYGKPYPHETRMRILGTTEQLTAKIAVSELDLPISTTQFHHLYTALLHKRSKNLSLLEGAERLIRHLHKHGIPICLATSSSEEMAEYKMTNHRELFDLFHHKVMGSTDPDVIDGKPAPDIFIVAGRRFPDKPKPENVSIWLLLIVK